MTGSILTHLHLQLHHRTPRKRRSSSPGHTVPAEPPLTLTRSISHPNLRSSPSPVTKTTSSTSESSSLTLKSRPHIHFVPEEEDLHNVTTPPAVVAAALAASHYHHSHLSEHSHHCPLFSHPRRHGSTSSSSSSASDESHNHEHETDLDYLLEDVRLYAVCSRTAF